jgi:hypothetical protein
MPLNISMEVTGVDFDDLRDRVDGISDALDDLSPISRELAEVVRDKHLNPLFLSEPSTLTGGVVYGGAYHAPLSRYTLLLHPERARGQVHIATGSLFQGAVTEGGSGNTYDVQGNEFTYELKDSRAPKLEGFGRPILYWHEELQEEMAKAVLAYLVKKWKGGK